MCLLMMITMRRVMKNKVFLITIGYTLLMMVELVSCKKCGPFPDAIKVVGLDWDVRETVYNSNKVSFSPILNDTVDYNLYSIWINPKTETYFSLNQNSFSFSLINTAHACSPGSDPQLLETIKDIEIISTKDFDANHLKGSNLVSLFDVVVKGQKLKLSDYLKTSPYVPEQMIFILNSPPDLTDKFEFTVKFHQNGVNKYFDFKTGEFVIKK